MTTARWPLALLLVAHAASAAPPATDDKALVAVVPADPARALLGQLGQAPAKRKGAVRDFVRADMRSALQSLRRRP